jgi:pimeloyl-ACP methyl ester carboxylesterase
MDLFAGANKALRRVLVARGVRSAFANVLGHPVHYYALRGEGTGTPVVLVHGLGGSANGFYKTFFLLAKRFSRVLALDLPGNGFSPLPSGGPASLVDQLAVLDGFCEEVVREQAFVVGNSLGGAMVTMLAHQRPERVKALALVSPAGAKVAQARMDELTAALNVRTTAQARALTRRLFHSAPLSFLMFSGELRKVYGTPAVRSVFTQDRPIEFIAPEVLGALGMPTLLLWGASEKLLPYESIDYFRQHLPKHAQVEVVKGFGHIPQMEKPVELVKRLIGFADGNRV